MQEIIDEIRAIDERIESLVQRRRAFVAELRADAEVSQLLALLGVRPSAATPADDDEPATVRSAVEPEPSLDDGELTDIERVRRVVAGVVEPVGIPWIVEHAPGVPRESVSTHLCTLVRRRAIERVSKGMYRGVER